MTDTLETVESEVTPRPKPVRRAPPARAKPAPRKVIAGVAETITVTTDALASMLKDAVAAAVAPIQAKVDRIERGNTMQFIESEPTPLPRGRVADLEELPTEWLRDLRRQTHTVDTASVVRREKNYNYPLRYFMTTGGDVVQLQGDPQNVTFYTDKLGFRLFSEAEEKHYLAVERPKVLKVQQAKANLINSIRRAVALDLTLENRLDPTWNTDLDQKTVPELQDQFDEIAGTPMSDGRPRRMFKRLQRLQDRDDLRAQAESDRMLAGVEMNGSNRDFERFHPEVRELEVTRANAHMFA